MASTNQNVARLAAKAWFDAAEEIGATGLDWFRDALDARTPNDLEDVHVFYANRQMQHVIDCLCAAPAKLADACLAGPVRSATRRSARGARA